MYPSRDLETLEARKKALLLRSEKLRQQCVEAWPEAVRPVVAADQALARARSLAPLWLLAAAIPVLVLTKGRFLANRRVLGLVASLGTYGVRRLVAKRDR